MPAGQPPGSATAVLDPLRDLAEVEWSAEVTLDGVVVDALDPARILPTASVGKIFLLAAVAAGIVAGELDPAELLEVRPELEVGDSGLLQLLHRRGQRLDDLCVLVGAVSDNLATNLLVDRVGLDAVAAAADQLGARHCRLHDRVRDRRRPPVDPPVLSSGCAGELRTVIADLTAASAASTSTTGGAASALVVGWLRANCDLSMVAGAFGLDPLAHRHADSGWELVNKTGTDTGTRADIGVVAVDGHMASYAVIARFEDARDTHGWDRRQRVLTALGEVGHGLATRLV